MLDHMDQHQHMAILQEPRVYALNNQAQAKLPKLTSPAHLVEPTTHKNQKVSFTTLLRPTYPSTAEERPMGSGIAIGAP
jgi:hypothetical protein